MTLNIESSFDHARYDVGALRAENECPTCHRADVVPDYAYSIEECVAKGWLVPVREVGL
jgi:hypothetical protein